MKISQFLKNIRKDQHGVAIVFTLGILGLLTVIALGFASTALLNGKLAKNISNDAYAKSMAKNLALSQALYTIYHVNAEPWTRDFGRIYSYDNTTEMSINGISIADKTKDFSKDFLWKLNADYNNQFHLFQYNPDLYTTYRYSDSPQVNRIPEIDALQEVRWKYVKDDSNNKIIGRFAYVVVPDKGSLNPNLHIGKTYSDANNLSDNEMLYPSQVLSFRTNNNETDNSSTVSSKLKDALSNKDVGTNNAFKFATFHDIIRKTALTTHSYFFESNGINISPIPKSREVYYNDDNSTVPIGRFDMKGAAWNSLTVANLMGLNKNETATTDENSCISLLQNMWVSANERETDTTRRQNLQNRYKQIAANIIQYNRSATADTVAMLKKEPVTTTTEELDASRTLNDCMNSNKDDIPVYMGIGKHPMLNEIGMYVRVAGGVLVSGEANNWKCTPYFNITMNIGAELVRLFSQIGEEPYQLFVYGTMSAEVEFPTAPNSKKQAKITLDLSSLNTQNDPIHKFEQECSSSYTSSDKFFYSPVENDTYSLGHQINLEAGETRAKITLEGIASPTLTDLTVENGDSLKQFTDPSDAEPDHSSSLKIKSVSFNLKKVILKCNDKIRDISVFKEQTNSTENSIPQCYYASFQAKNPLMNLNKDSNEWNCSIQSNTDENMNAETYNSVNGTAGKVNSELESECPFSDPAYGSTQLPFAFMRQGPMQSFAEFACIHSGKGWNTLDLTTKIFAKNPDSDVALEKYPSYDENNPPFGAIFDQVKFTSGNQTNGQINLNTDSHAAFYSLLQYIDRRKLNLPSSSNTILGALTNEASTQYSIPLRFCLPPCDTIQRNNPSSDPRQYSFVSNHENCAACILRDCVIHSYTDAEMFANAKVDSPNSNRPFFLFRNRGDLLAYCDPQDGLLSESSLTNSKLLGYEQAKFASFWRNLNDVRTHILNKGTDQTRKNIIIATLMDNVRTAPVDSAYIIIVAQSIQDIGNTPIFIDWNNDGEFSPSPVAVNDQIRKRLGYRYTNSSGTVMELPGAPETIKETFTAADTQIGRYDLGADKITGEAKLIAKVVRDGITGKWKIVEIRYVE